MKKVLIDINILIDMITERADFHSATAVFDLCAKRKIKGFVCSHEITTLSYFLERFSFPPAKSANVIVGILDTMTVLPATEGIFREALLSPIKDFEDAVIEVSAIKEQVECVVTRNLKDFQIGRIDCYTGAEFLSLQET